MEDIARGVRSFTIGTAISRILGLVREMVFAHLVENCVQVSRQELI